MKHYNFIEIGTAFFGTLIETAGPEVVGISVEPIKEYLDRLPNPPNVKKLHAAITDKKTGPTIQVFYVPTDVIVSNKLGDWLAGCNSVNKPHDFHLYYTDDPGYWLSRPELKMEGRNLVTEGIVRCEAVPVLTFVELGVSHDVGHVDFVKIDAEGHDPYVVSSVLEYYRLIGKEFLPKKIQFEKSRHSDPNLVQAMIKDLQATGYEVTCEFNDGYAILK